MLVKLAIIRTMKLIRTLKVTPQEFFDYVEMTLSHQGIYSSPSFTKDEIKTGLKYTIIDESQLKTSVTLLKYHPYDIYQSKVTNVNDTVILTYQIQQINDGIQVIFEQSIDSFNNIKPNRNDGIQVIFEQSIDSFNNIKPNSLNAKFQETFYLGRMSDQLFKIEKDIIAIRNGESIENTSKRKSLFNK